VHAELPIKQLLTKDSCIISNKMARKVRFAVIGGTSILCVQIAMVMVGTLMTMHRHHQLHDGHNFLQCGDENMDLRFQSL
jgi:hypothetical protein